MPNKIHSNQLLYPLSGSFSGSLQGTASFAVSASWAPVPVIDTGSLLTTSSFNAWTGSTTSQFAGTSSYALTASNSVTASFALTASYYGGSVVSASYATTSSYAIFAETASYSTQASDIILQVINQSGAQINKGIVVRITGSNNSSDTPRIGVADWTNDAYSANTLGLVMSNISNGGTGYVMTEGLFTGYDTSTPGWTTGQVVYLGPNGSITGSAPQAPLHSVRLGQVTRVQSQNGAIYVRIDNGYELDELHDVLITNVATGDLLTRSGSVWTNSKTLSGSYTLSGSLTTNDGVQVQTLTASFISASGGITGSLFGTSSWSTNAITSYTPISITGSTLYSTSPSTGNVSSNNSIFLGSNAGGGATGASLSVVLGYYAGQLASNATETVIIGAAAGLEAIRADHSVFLGPGAGYKAVSASYSILLGAYAGSSGDTYAASIGTNNIILGNYVSLPSKSRDSVNIGGIIFATGSYSTFGTVYSGSQYNIGRVGINKVTPQYTLDVSGSGNYSNGLTVTGSLIASSFTGSLQGTSSWASNAITASYVETAQTASYVLNAVSASFASTVPSTGILGDLSRIASGSVTASVTPTQFSVVSGSSTEFTVTGTGVAIGSALTDSHQVTGSLRLTGSLNISGSTTFNASIIASSSIARGTYFNQSLTAAANSDVLVNTDINSTFTNGAFTGVANWDLRTSRWANFGTTNNTGIVIGNPIWSGGVPTNGYQMFASSGTGAVHYIGSGGGFTIKFRTSANTDANNRLVIGDNNIQITGSLNVGTALNTNVSTNNVQVGTVTDAGFKFDVNGTTRIIDNTFLATNAASRVIIGSSSLDTTNIAGFEIKSSVTGSGAAGGTTRGIYFQPSTLNTGSGGVVTGFEVLPSFGGNGTGGMTLRGHRLGISAAYTNFNIQDLQATGLDLPLNMGYSVGNTGGIFRIINSTPTYTYNQTFAFNNQLSASVGAPIGSSNIGLNFSPTYTAPAGTYTALSGHTVSIRPTFTGGITSVNGGSQTIPYSHVLMYLGAQFNHLSASGTPVYSRGIYYSASLAAPNSSFGFQSAFENANGSNFFNQDNGNTGIGYAAQTAALPAKLSVNGSALVTNGLTVTGSLNITGSVLIAATGSLTVGASSSGPAENTLTLGARDNGSEGGQLGFNAPGGTYTSASYLDNYANTFRLLKGTNSGTTTNLASVDLQTGNMTLNVGSIVMPARPAFRVVGAQTGAAADKTVNSILSGSLVTVDYNQGSYYNNTNGQFTCPIAGLYHVWYVGRSQNAGGPNSVAIYKNNATVLTFWENNGTNIGHFGTSAIVNLAVNDVVTAKVTAGTITFDNNDNWGVAYIG